MQRKTQLDLGCALHFQVRPGHQIASRLTDIPNLATYQGLRMKNQSLRESLAGIPLAPPALRTRGSLIRRSFQLLCWICQRRPSLQPVPNAFTTAPIHPLRIAHPCNSAIGKIRAPLTFVQVAAMRTPGSPCTAVPLARVHA